jgi:phage terminase large subunit-like protein
VLYGNNNGVKIDKEKATTKIDFVDALIDAWYTAMFHFDDISMEKLDAKNPFSGMSNDDINDYFTNDFSF